MCSRLMYCICSLLFGLLGLVLTVAALLLWAEFDNFYGGTVRSQMSIDNQSINWWFDKWYEPPVKHSLTIHIFELENAAEWRRSPADTRLMMREVGPFVFKVFKRKEDWNYSDVDHHQIWYNERTSYQFDELLSYQSLDKTAIVVNAELMVIAPFVNSMVRRVASVTRISRSLNNTASQILSIYRSNLFIERSIDRIIFGPESLSNNPLASLDINEDLDGELEREDEPTTPKVINARQEMPDNGTSSSNEYAWVMNVVQDNATVRILALYERAAIYFQKLGVQVNPFELIAAQFNRENSASIDDIKRLRINSILSFYQNNSLERYDLWTGKNQPGRQARLMRWNNKSKLQVWPGKPCNELNGTDGRQFSPFLKRRRIYLFERRICRSIPFTFGTPQSTPQSVDIHRYNRASDFLLSPAKAPGNSCFCRSSAQTQKRRNRRLLDDKGKGCNYDGILDLGSCYTGYGEGLNSSDAVNGAVPLVLSAVHFSGPFTKSIAREVKGVVPDEQLYQSVLDIEPVSGIVLHRTVKYQFNMHVAPFPVGTNRTTREVVVPLLWQDEQFTVNSDHLNSIKYLFVYPFKYRELALLATGALGGGALLLATIFICCCCCSKSNADQKKRLMSEEPITKGTGKYSGKVTPVDDNNNTSNGNGKQAIAWNNNNLKHQQTEEEDAFELVPDDEDAYRDDEDAYDPNAMVAPTNRIMENDAQSYYNNNVRQNMPQYTNNHVGRADGGNQYPLERLKRDMPARQTSVPQPNQRRPNGNNNFDNHGGPDFYPNRFGNVPDNSGAYDVFGDNHFANPKAGGPPPPPLPPPSFGMPNDYNDDGTGQMPPQANNDRENLLRQIRAGTQLKRTGDSPPNMNEVDTFEKQMAMTSMLIIQQLLSQQHEQARWQHIQVTQDALAAQMMRQLMPYVSLSLPHSMPNYIPAIHHEQTEAMFLAPAGWPAPQPQPIALPPIESDTEYASRSHTMTNVSNNSGEESEFQENRSQTRLRRRMPDLSIDIDEFDSTTESTEAPDNDNYHSDMNTKIESSQSNGNNSPNRMMKNNSNTGKAEEIRFYGPYRAYMGPKVEGKHSTSTISVMEDDWDSDFNDDDHSVDDGDDEVGPIIDSKVNSTGDSYRKHPNKHFTNNPRVDVPVNLTHFQPTNINT